ncbi:MAG: DUF192 domain-containing protein [bacterium]|nr:DUF192 domain-containing protein [bacterium]
MKDKFFLLVGLVVIISSFYLFLQKPAPAKYQEANSLQLTANSLKIGDASIRVEIADTEEERNQGLSDRLSIDNGSGMLFIFEIPGTYGFWMHDMNFPIDIVWIASDWNVVGVQTQINPDTYPEVFYPPNSVKYVLEINSGEASRLGIDTGSILYFDTQN